MTSRPAPPRFEGCAFDGVRYDANYTSTETTRSAGVVALDEAGGGRLWTLELWTELCELEGGLMVPPRFLHRMSRGEHAGQLRVVDEFGVVYLVDLATRAARCVGRPSEPGRETIARAPLPPDDWGLAPTGD